MKKEKITEAYKQAEQYVKDNPDNFDLQGLVQIGFQMAINDEILYDDNGRILRIE